MFISEITETLMIEENVNFVVFNCREFLENKNATFHENGTLSFVPVRHNIYSPERSKGDPMKDVVTALNLPLLGISSAMNDFSTIGSLAISTLAKSVNAQPILNLTVHDYLWGYDDPLVRLASNIAPTIINFERFGLLDRVNITLHESTTW